MDDKEEDDKHPEFGDSQSSYEEVSKKMYFVNQGPATLWRTAYSDQSVRP